MKTQLTNLDIRRNRTTKYQDIQGTYIVRVQICVYEVQEQAKLIHGNRGQTTIYLEEGNVGKRNGSTLGMY